MRAGRTGYHNGLAAEDIAERLYLDRGASVLQRRWRRREGEIDLILREGAVTVFAEVKARRSHAAAAESLSSRQMARLAATAGRYLAESGLGLSVEVRFDLVTVDATGTAEILENAVAAGW